MSFAAVEQLKAQYTDKLVEVDPSVPELRRFKGLIGTVKTVNMNGRLLIQFDHPVDIGWYDIDPAYLRIVEGKTKKAPAAKSSEKAAVSPPASAVSASAPAKPEPQPAVSTSTGSMAAAAKPLSKLEQARQQGAAGKVAPAAPSTATTSGAVAPAAGGRPLSKLEMARMQGAAGSAKSPPAATPSAPSAPAIPSTQSPPVKAPASATGGKPLSKLELARQQGAFGGGGGASAPAASSPVPAASAAAPASPPAPPAASTPKTIAKTGPDGKPLSKLELARLQGPFKG